MPNRTYLSLLLLLSASLCQAGTVGSAFTYQGELKQTGVRANGAFDFQFELFNLDIGGSSIAAPVLLEDVQVVDGVFTVELDFGSAPFDGDQLWLEVGVREGASAGGYTGLLPRQKLTAAPYALRALNDSDAQDLSLAGNTLSLTNDATSVDLSGYLDDTDTDDQTLSEVLAQGNNAGGQSLVGIQDLTATGTTTTGALTVSGLNCSANANGGALTADSRGVVSCSDDDAGQPNTLDAAYDQGGSGAGRTITADSGAVVIQGTGGLDLDGGDLFQSPGDPVLVASLALGTTPGSVMVSGRYAYVTDSGSGDLRIIDVSDPGAPGLVGNVAVGGGLLTSVFVSGRYAYVLDATTPGNLYVIDVSNPSAPVSVGQRIVGAASAVVVSGRYAYTTASPLLGVHDVSDPFAPSTVDVSVISGGVMNDVVMSGRYVYVSTSAELHVVDASDPSNLSLAGTLPFTGGLRSIDAGGRYVVGIGGAAGAGTLTVIDVSDPSTPAVAGSLGIGGVPRSVSVSGRYAYVVDESSEDLKVIDLADPTAPVPAGSLAIGTRPFSVSVSGRYAYVVDTDTDDLKIIDVSGAEVTSLVAHSLEAGSLQVLDDVVAQGRLDVRDGVTVGIGGLYSDGNVGISGTLALANGATPTSSPANLVQLYAEDSAGSSELKVRDEAGNVTTLSPHNFSLLGAPSEPMAWSFYSENDQGSINVDMLRTVRLVEQLSGQTLVYLQPAGDGGLEAAQPDGPPAVGLIDAMEALKAEKDREISQLNAQNEMLERRLEALESRPQ